MKLLRFKYAGGLELEEVAIRPEYIVAIEKTKNGKFGCIITTDDGDKFPVVDSYDEVIDRITNYYSVSI